MLILKLLTGTTVILSEFAAKHQKKAKTKGRKVPVKVKYKEGLSCKKLQKPGRLKA